MHHFPQVKFHQKTGLPISYFFKDLIHGGNELDLSDINNAAVE